MHTAVAPTARGAQAPALEILTAFFTGCDRLGIRYCHWKSNEHLGASLSGATDVDILVDRQHALALARLLAELGCKRFLVKPGRGYPGIEDYLAFDSATGTLSHIHVHYQLTLGEHFLKGYRLPWEDRALATRVRDAASGVWVTDPHLELLILVCRAALKLRFRDTLKVLAQRRWPRGDMLREFLWLARRIDRAQLAEVARPLVGPHAVVQLLGLLDESPPSFRRLRKFRDAARPRFGSHRLYPPSEARRRRWTIEASIAWAIAWDLLRQGRRISSRTSPHGGLAVACVGGPGSDAPHLARDLAKWLAHDAAVLNLPADSSGSAHARALKMRRARGLGLIVVTDRAISPGDPPPDLVLRLTVSPEVARQRSPDTTDEEIAAAAAALAQLQAAEGGRLVDVNADGAPEATLLAAQRALWDAI